jgi:quinol-cytochrome oxidoreductase complex cytochrome b subunit
MESSERHKLLKALPVDVERLYEKVDEALPHSAKRWWWCWGGLVGLLFVLQVVTGLLLAFYYRAGPEQAYQAISFISADARFGQFIRSVHHWGATFMIVLLFLHMLRVFVTGAYRDYRWGAWMIGVCLLGVTLGLGFTGYALVSDQLSYWAVTVTSNIIAATPFLGNALKNLFLAGDTISVSTGSRMYALHVQVLPAALILLGVAHLFFVRLMGMYRPGTAQDQEREKTLAATRGPYHFYPDHVLSELAVFLYLVLLIFLLALAAPAPLGPPADPAVTPEHIKPEWYFYPFFHLLKILPGSGGVLLMAVLGLGLFFWPLLDHYLLRPADRVFKGKLEWSLILGVIVIAISLWWALAEAGH